MDWKHRFLRMLVAGEIVPFRNKLDKEIVNRLIERIESDPELMSTLSDLQASGFRRAIEELIEQDEPRD